MRRLLMLTLASVLAASSESGSTLFADAPQSAGIPRGATVASRLTVVALGDSLTSGHRLPRAQAYPALVEAELRDGGLPITVVNHGVNGDTTAGAARRLEAALAED